MSALSADETHEVTHASSDPGSPPITIRHYAPSDLRERVTRAGLDLLACPPVEGEGAATETQLIAVR